MASVNPLKDGWDWPFIIYAGTVLLRRSEAEVWLMTPRKLYALLKVYSDLEAAKWGSNDKAKKPGQTLTQGYIDNVPGW
jgi:hypothetical protein